MAQDETTLYNLAISSAGGSSFISAPSENSREAEICRLWFAPVSRQILRAAPWSSTRAVSRLALITERVGDVWAADEPRPEYSYAYGLPERCLRPLYLYGYPRFDVALLSAGQQALMTDQENAILYYTYDQADISMWDADLFLAVAHGMASQICNPLTGKTQKALRALQEANGIILQAREAAANESYAPVEAVPIPLQARGSAYNAPMQRYVYPNGPLLTVTNG